MGNTLTMKRRVQFSETDMAGVLHFAGYYRIMEEIEHALWRECGLSVMTQDGDRPIGWPRVSTSCEYFGPARFEDELELTLRVAAVSEQSVSYEVDFLLDGRRIATGRMTAVCCVIDNGAFTPTAIPARLRAVLEGRRDQEHSGSI